MDVQAAMIFCFGVESGVWVELRQEFLVILEPTRRRHDLEPRALTQRAVLFEHDIAHGLVEVVFQVLENLATTSVLGLKFEFKTQGEVAVRRAGKGSVMGKARARGAPGFQKPAFFLVKGLIFRDGMPLRIPVVGIVPMQQVTFDGFNEFLLARTAVVVPLRICDGFIGHFGMPAVGDNDFPFGKVIENLAIKEQGIIAPDEPKEVFPLPILSAVYNGILKILILEQGF